MFVGVDGCVNGPGGAFIGPEWSADLDAWTDAMVARYDTLVYGRRCWQDMAEYWPSAPADDTVNASARRLTHFMNDTRKLVFSRTLTTAAAWANSVLADGEIGEVLAREKAAPGGDLVIYGGADFAQAAERTDLIDEYTILTIPTIFGGGSRLFGDSGIQRPLQLLESRRLDTGAVLSHYARIADV